MKPTTPVSRTEHDRLSNSVRQLKARLCLGLPILGLTLAQLVPTAQHGSSEVPVSELLTLYRYRFAAALVLISAAATIASLAWAALVSSQGARIAAVALAVLNGVATVVLWARLRPSPPYLDDFEPMVGYFVLPVAAVWAAIGAGVAREYVD